MGDGNYFIDLENASKNDEISLKISSVLRSNMWGDSASTNLDSLMEYVWAFFQENWCRELFVHVKIPNHTGDRFLLLKLVATFYEAYINSMASILGDGELTIANIRNTKLFFYAESP